MGAAFQVAVKAALQSIRFHDISAFRLLKRNDRIPFAADSESLRERRRFMTCGSPIAHGSGVNLLKHLADWLRKSTCAFRSTPWVSHRTRMRWRIHLPKMRGKGLWRHPGQTFAGRRGIKEPMVTWTAGGFQSGVAASLPPSPSYGGTSCHRNP